MTLRSRLKRAIISIHALLAESDLANHTRLQGRSRFLSTLSLRRATSLNGQSGSPEAGFLSTLSLRRATPGSKGGAPCPRDFYPRSPCGERHIILANRVRDTQFLSTLSLRRATLKLCQFKIVIIFLSTLSLRRATLSLLRSVMFIALFLSTLSLRRATAEFYNSSGVFLFLSTLSLRRATMFGIKLGVEWHFYPRSPCGERLGLDGRFKL